jgi:hypothetical protein
LFTQQQPLYVQPLRILLLRDPAQALRGRRPSKLDRARSR